MRASSKLPGDTQHIYTEWEQHKLAVEGLRRLAQVGIAAPLLLLIATLFVPGFSGGRALPIVALLLVAAGATVVFVRVRSKGVDLPQPLHEGAALLVALIVAGALAARPNGQGAWPYALSPLLLAWPVLMPGGLRRAWLPIGAGTGLHLGIIVGRGAEAPVALALLTAFIAVFAVVLSEVTEQLRVRAAACSQKDWLTGALEKNELMHRLGALLNLRQRVLEPFCAVMIDLDRFKTLNTEHGRAAGDEALELVAATIDAELRPSDLCGRLGGDEFLLVLDHCDAEGAMTLVRRLQERLAETEMLVDGNRVRVSFAAGIVPFGPGQAPDPKTLVDSAQRALADSQEHARNRTSISAVHTEELGGAELDAPAVHAKPRRTGTEPALPIARA